MDVRSLIAQLEGEVAELQGTIKVLRARGGGSSTPAKKPGQPAAHGRVWSAKDRAAMSRRVKAALAAKKKAKAARKAGRKPKPSPKPQTQS